MSLDLQAQTGADIIAIDHLVDLRQAKEQIGERVCLIGNIDPVGVMLNGTPELVEARAQECLASAAEGAAISSGRAAKCRPAHRWRTLRR